MSDHNIQDHIKVYRHIFLALLVFTVITVAISYVHFDLVWVGILVGLLIAGIKGYLVAANFMHLNNEKKMIYWILILTASFLVLLFFMPTLWENNIFDSETTVLFDKSVERLEKSSH